MHDAFSEAREYLSRVLPWPQDGEPPAWLNIHWSFKSKNHKGKGWAGRACQSVDEMVRAVEWALKGEDTLDIYACQSSQSIAENHTNAKGYTTHRAVRNGDNVVRMKAFYLDLDAKGTDKDSYASMDELIEAFAGFLAFSKLPLPSVKITTGGGLHAYWVISRNMTVEEWQPLAFALVEAGKQFGLKWDAGCTIDSVRILRVPNTWNRKSEPPRPVLFAGKRAEGDFTFEYIANILAPFKVHVPAAVRQNDGVDLTLFPPKTPIVDKLGQGVEEAPDYVVALATVIPECPFIKEAVTSGGKDYANPLWNITTLLATFTDGGRQDAHLMARRHPGYTVETTDGLFDRKLEERKSKGLGWPHCRTIANNGSKNCATCPHLQLGKTPFHFAKRPQAAATASPGQLVTPLAAAGATGASQTAPVGVPPIIPGIPVLPPGADLPPDYTRDANGIVHFWWVDDEGAKKSRPVCHYPMTQPWLQENPHGLHFSTITHKPTQIFLLSEVVGGMEMRKTLQGQGLMLYDKEAKIVTEFFVSWIQTLKATKNAVVSTTPFGWNNKNGKLEGFVYGGNLWMPSGFRIAPSPDPVIALQYSPTGDVAPWTKAAKLITDQDRPDLNAIIASAFAAPLVTFTGHDGFLLSVWSGESGIGKTTAMKVAQAVWGDPVRALQGLSDTQNSVFNKIGELRSLPLYWDELKTEDDTKRFVNGVFQMTSGKEKSRLTSRVVQKQVGTWQTLLVSASNESIVDFVASRTRMTTAGILRVFEYEVRPGRKGQISPGDAQRTIADLNNNYGGIGLEYSKFLGSNYAQLDLEVNDERRKIEVETSVEVDERFWCSLIAALIVGARISNRLGFTTINEEGLKTFLIATMEEMRGIRKSQPNDMSKVLNVSDLLGQFLASMAGRHTLKTNRIWTSAGKPAKGAIVVKSNTQGLDGVYVQIGVDDKLMRVSSAALTLWCKERELSRQLLTKALASKFGMKVVNGHIGSGTSFGQPAGYMLEIDLGQFPELEHLTEI